MDELAVIDTHCHLDFKEFEIDRDSVVKSAWEKGVGAFIIPGVSLRQSASQFSCLNQLQSQHWISADKNIVERSQPLFRGTVGLHPWWVEQEQNFFSKEQLKESLSQFNSVAVGECGLDGAIDTPMEIQKRVLAIHLELAVDLNLPIILHARRAHNELLQMLPRYQLSAGGVVHAFSGSEELGKQYVRHGLSLGVGGVITYQNARKTHRALAKLPLQSLVLETDAPSLPIQTVGRSEDPRNKPEYLPLIVAKLAQLRQESVLQIAVQTTKNATSLFGL